MNSSTDPLNLINICCKKHNFDESENGDIIISCKEFLHLICCLSEERNAICEDCGKCDKCKNVLDFISKFRQIKFDVRKTAGNYIILLRFNKHKKKLLLEYARIFSSFMEAEKMRIFLI